MKIPYVRVNFENQMNPSDAAKIRGYIGNKYDANNLTHNHEGEHYIYRYPLIQYKVIDKQPMICGLLEGAQVATQIALEVNEMTLAGKKIDTLAKSIEVEQVEVGESTDYIHYQFITPWIALNDENVKKYKEISQIEQENLLKRILIGNIITFSKGIAYTVQTQLYAWIALKPVTVQFKNMNMQGFVGEFKVNYELPNYIGIGKSISRGFGTIKKVR